MRSTLASECVRKGLPSTSSGEVFVQTASSRPAPASEILSKMQGKNCNCTAAGRYNHFFPRKRFDKAIATCDEWNDLPFITCIRRNVAVARPTRRSPRWENPAMMHFSCDGCGQELKRQRFVIKMEAYEAADTTVLMEDDLEESNLEAVAEILRDMDDGLPCTLPLATKHWHFDLCPQCHGRLARNPLARSTEQALHQRHIRASRKRPATIGCHAFAAPAPNASPYQHGESMPCRASFSCFRGAEACFGVVPRGPESWHPPPTSIFFHALHIPCSTSRSGSRKYRRTQAMSPAFALLRARRCT